MSLLKTQPKDSRAVQTTMNDSLNVQSACKKHSFSPRAKNTWHCSSSSRRLDLSQLHGHFQKIALLWGAPESMMESLHDSLPTDSSPKLPPPDSWTLQNDSSQPGVWSHFGGQETLAKILQRFLILRNTESIVSGSDQQQHLTEFSAVSPN